MESRRDSCLGTRRRFRDFWLTLRRRGPAAGAPSINHFIVRLQPRADHAQAFIEAPEHTGFASTVFVVPATNTIWA